MVAHSILLSKQVLRSATNLTSKANICHKSKLPEKNVYHWPYKTKSYNMLTMWRDLFTKRKMDENSVIIQIEGNIGAGKGKFARIIADELGMKYLPQPDLESVYYNSHGFDFRSLNPQLPERLRVCDWKMLHENPSRHSAIHLLYYMQALRLMQYLEATSHVMNTGQGVVLERSVFTEKVIIDAMHNIGWLPRGHVRADGLRFYDWINRYELTRTLMCTGLLAPKLTIYLDVDPSTCKKRLDASLDPMIRNSRFLVLPLLEEIQKAYENDMLDRTKHYGHLLMYDNNNEMDKQDLSEIIYDIEQLDFEYFPLSTQFDTWESSVPFGWHNDMRRMYTTKKGLEKLIQHLNQPTYDIAGIGDSVTHHDLDLREQLIQSHVVGYRYFKEHDPLVTSTFDRLFKRLPVFENVKRSVFADFN